MSSDRPCGACPFREGSKMAYDADALEALDHGCEPSCHQVVGAQAIFHDEPPAHPCIGHQLWCDGFEGFAIPRAASTPDIGDAS